MTKRKKKKKDRVPIELGSQELERNEDGTLTRKVDGEKFRFAFYGQDRHLEKVHKSVLENYFARNLLDIKDRESNSRRFWAGQKFEKICHRAGLNPRVTARLTEYIGGTREDFLHRNIDAHSEFHIIIKEIGNCWNILWDVIVVNKPAGTKKMNKLRDALDTLVDYFKM